MRRKTAPCRAARFWSQGARVGLVAIAIGCSRDDRVVDPLPTAAICPPGFTANPQRTARLHQLLRQAPEGPELLATAGTATFCFGAIDESSVTERERVLLLRSRTGDVELACRTAHLLTHLADPLPVPTPGRCDDWLDRVREKEAHAHRIENRLRRHFGLEEPSPQQFEALMTQYASRCRSASQPPPANSVSTE